LKSAPVSGISEAWGSSDISGISRFSGVSDIFGISGESGISKFSGIFGEFSNECGVSAIFDSVGAVVDFFKSIHPRSAGVSSLSVTLVVVVDMVVVVEVVSVLSIASVVHKSSQPRSAGVSSFSFKKKFVVEVVEDGELVVSETGASLSTQSNISSLGTSWTSAIFSSPTIPSVAEDCSTVVVSGLIFGLVCFVVSSCFVVQRSIQDGRENLSSFFMVVDIVVVLEVVSFSRGSFVAG
jgi:hypothetical protein